MSRPDLALCPRHLGIPLASHGPADHFVAVSGDGRSGGEAEPASRPDHYRFSARFRGDGCDPKPAAQPLPCASPAGGRAEAARGGPPICTAVDEHGTACAEITCDMAPGSMVWRFAYVLAPGMPRSTCAASWKLDAGCWILVAGNWRLSPYNRTSL